MMTTTLMLAGLAISQASPIALSAPKISQGFRTTAVYPGPTGSRFVAALENHELRIIDANTRLTVRTFSGHPQVPYAVTWSSNGKLVASGDESGRVFIWDAATGKKLREMRNHTRGVQYVHFDHTGSTLVSTGKDDTIRFYQVSSGKQLKVIPGNGMNFYGARFIDTSQDVIVATLSNGVRVYSKYVGVRGFSGHSDNATWDVAKRGGWLVSAGRDATALLYDWKSGKKVQTLRGHADWIVRTEFSPNGRFLATSSTDQTVRLWDLKTFRTVATLSQQSSIGSPVCFTPDGRYFVSSGADDYLAIYAVTPPVR